MKAFSALSIIGLVFSVNASAQDVLWAANGSNITIQPGANMYVGGGMQLDNNTTLTNKGTLLLDKVKGGTANFTDHSAAAYTYGSGTFIFSGTGSQDIKSINRFGRIEVDNNGLMLLSDTRADNWYLKSGRINTGSFYAIVTSPDADAIVADIPNSKFRNSWFNGNLRRYITPGAVNNYAFPVGDGARAYMLEMDNLVSRPMQGISYIDAGFSATGGGTVTNLSENGKPYKAISNAGTWRLVPDVVPVSGAFDLKLYFNEFSGLSDNRFAILNKTNGTGWLLPAGTILPADGTLGRTLAGGYALRNNVSSFNQFAIGVNGDLAETKPVSLTVYPDPVTNNEFFIRAGNYRITGFKLFAADGKEVNITGTLLQKNDIIKVSLPTTIAKGVYTIRLNTSLGLQTKQVVVQ